MKGVAFHEEGADTLHQGNEARLNEISGDITKLWIRRVNLTEIATEGVYEDELFSWEDSSFKTMEDPKREHVCKSPI